MTVNPTETMRSVKVAAASKSPVSLDARTSSVFALMRVVRISHTYALSYVCTDAVHNHQQQKTSHVSVIELETFSVLDHTRIYASHEHEVPRLNNEHLFTTHVAGANAAHADAKSHTTFITNEAYDPAKVCTYGRQQVHHVNPLTILPASAKYKLAAKRFLRTVSV